MPNALNFIIRLDDSQFGLDEDIWMWRNCTISVPNTIPCIYIIVEQIPIGCSRSHAFGLATSLLYSLTYTSTS
jgi:hypothetical protein